MRSISTLILLSVCVLWISPAQALLELGATANYRKSVIDDNNYQESVSYTGSISYYFWEMSALELSYTSGASQVVITPSQSEPRTTITTSFYLAGADLVFTFAGRESAFQPYLKLGAAYIEKEIIREIEGGATTSIGNPKGTVPSAGLGFKIRLNKTFSIKAGVDAWTSPLSEEDVTIDYAGRVGFSWFL